MAKKRNDEQDLPDPAAMSFEQAMTELESINQRIEQGTISLEDSLAAYKRGIALSKRCGSILDSADQELKTIKPGGDEEVKR